MGASGGLLAADNTYSPYNLGGVKRTPQSPAAQSPSAQNNPYQGGLKTNPSGSAYLGQDHVSSMEDAINLANRRAAASSNDPDINSANSLYNEDASARAGNNDGVDFSHNAALENMYETRIGLKNNLSEQINDAPGLLNQQQDQNKLAAGEAVGQGLKNTRSNYNSRGLLYSGAREGGEQKVQSAGASQLAQSMAGTARDSANAVDSAKAAYAAVDLANQQDTLNRANQAFDTANQNNIARLQATQQLYGGLGRAAGTIAGGLTRPGQNQQPTGPSNYNTTSTGYYDSGNSYGQGSGMMGVA